MKTFKNLYPKIHTFENLETAFHKARRGKRSRPNVAAFETELAQNLLELQDDLANQTYRPGGYHLRRREGRGLFSVEFHSSVTATCKDNNEFIKRTNYKPLGAVASFKRNQAR